MDTLMPMPDRLLAVTERPYESEGLTYRVIRCYWSSGRTTFKDTGAHLKGLSDDWQIGQNIPTPKDIEAEIQGQYATAFPVDALDLTLSPDVAVDD